MACAKYRKKSPTLTHVRVFESDNKKIKRLKEKHGSAAMVIHKALLRMK